MKWATKQLDTFLRASGHDAFPSFLCVYGEDTGLCKEYASKVAHLICPDMNDPFLVDRFRVEDVVEHSSCLLESVQTVSLGFGHKLVYLQGVSKDLPSSVKDKVNKAIQDVLSYAVENVSFVFAASGYEPKIALIKAIEKHEKAIAVRCYQDSNVNIKSLIQLKVQETKQIIQPDALSFLIENLGNDRAVTQGEIEKLLTFTHGEDQITLQHCLDSLSAAPSVNAFKLCDAIGLRQKNQVESYLKYLKEEGQDATMILAMVIRHMRRLLLVSQMQKKGMSADQAMMSLKPPVFYGKQEFSAQVRAYPTKRLENALNRLLDIQYQSRFGAVDPHMVIERGILALSF